MPKLAYVNIPNKVGLSYSKLGTLHQCPRKFKIQELQGMKESFSTPATNFGHLLAGGIQLLFQTGSIERAVVGMMAHWEFGLDGGDPKSKRTLGMATYSLQIFYANHYPEISEEWEFFGEELFFLLMLTDEYFYQGHIDLVLKNKFTGALRVVEIKTTTFNLTEGHWVNSDQTGGYQVVMRAIAKKHGCIVDPEVLYIVIDPRKVLDFEADNGYQFFTFHKGYTAGATFLQNLFTDIEHLQGMKARDFYPMRGGACMDWNRSCSFLGTCDMKSLDILYGSSNNAYADLPIEEVEYVLEAEEVINYLSESA